MHDPIMQRPTAGQKMAQFAQRTIVGVNFETTERFASRTQDHVTQESYGPTGIVNSSRWASVSQDLSGTTIIQSHPNTLSIS